MLTMARPEAITIKAKLFRGFADPSRLAILDALRARPMTVGEIVETTALNQPNASSHLACLHDCGLVVRAQDGRYVRYRLSDRRVSTLLRLGDELLADVAKGVYECTRYETPKSGRGRR